MTFSEFQLSGQPTRDIGAEIDAPDLAGVPGRVYAGKLHIEAHSLWEATIGRERIETDDLADLELRLFEYAESEGIL